MKVSRELRREIFGSTEFIEGSTSLSPGLTVKHVSDYWADHSLRYAEEQRWMRELGYIPKPIMRTTAYILRGHSGRILLSFTVRPNGQRIEGVTD